MRGMGGWVGDRYNDEGEREDEVDLWGTIFTKLAEEL